MATIFDLRASLPKVRGVNSAAESGDVDQALVQAARSGDRAAFGMLYSRYARMVHGILLAKVPHAAVEDLVQDVFLQALPRLGSLRDDSRFGGWLAAIARNRATDYHRRARPSEEFDETVHVGLERHQTPSATDQVEATQMLEAIRTLPETYRETLILRFVEGMSGAEIAVRTGLTAGSVRVNLHRGMQQLRDLLGGKTVASGSPASSAHQ